MLLSGRRAVAGRRWPGMFQSLLWWMLLSGTGEAYHGGRRSQCFNPCCGGCCSAASAVCRDPRRTDSGFNPCSGGCCSRLGRRRPRRCRLLRFQSLFWWMLLSGLACRPVRRWGPRSFNPCSRGCCSVAAAARRGHDCRSEGFNPCSRGCCSMARHIRAWPVLATACFNPCSRGCCSSARRR